MDTLVTVLMFIKQSQQVHIGLSIRGKLYLQRERSQIRVYEADLISTHHCIRRASYGSTYEREYIYCREHNQRREDTHIYSGEREKLVLTSKLILISSESYKRLWIVM